MNANISKIIILLAVLAFISGYNSALAGDKTIGISEINIAKISQGNINLGLLDSDKDGLDNELEASNGTNPNKADTDNDSYSDKTEIDNNYSPLGKNKLKIDFKLSQRLAGYYLLRVEKRGELWYVNPKDKKRYLVGNSKRKKLLFEKINASVLTTSTTSVSTINDTSILSLAANKIRANEKDGVVALFTESNKENIAFTLENFNEEQRFLLAGIIDNAKLTSQSETEKKYTSEVFFNLQGKKSTVNISTTKQPDGTWLISEL